MLNAYLLGWANFFGICTAAVKSVLQHIDGHTRRGVRAIQLHHWKRKATMVRNIIKLGLRADEARSVYAGKRSTWKLSHIPAVDRALTNEHLAELGLRSLVTLWSERQRIAAPAQGILRECLEVVTRPTMG